MPTVQVLDAKGKQAGSLELKPDVFGVEISVPLLHQAVTRELADRRAGTHDTKGRSEVSGGGRKPWKQKGTGRARQGSTRAVQWKGGGKPFGPTPRSYDKDLPRSMRRGALRAAVAAKVAAGQLSAVETIDVPDGKTKSLVTRLGALGLAGEPTLLVVRELGRDRGAGGAQRAVADRRDARSRVRLSAPAGSSRPLRARRPAGARGGPREMSAWRTQPQRSRSRIAATEDRACRSRHAPLAGHPRSKPASRTPLQ